MNGLRGRVTLILLQNAPFLLFAALIVTFGLMSDRFLTPVNFVNIFNQASHIAIIAVGMTFVLLIAGIDLSVGANMYLSAVILGVFFTGMPPVVAFPLVAVMGLAFGAVNAAVITQLRVAAFITTLSTLFIGRGVALYFSGNKMVPFSKNVLTFGRSTWLGIPSAIWVFAVVLIIALVVLKLTSFGRQVYAIGADPDAAAKAGINVKRVIFSVYCICGVCAAVGGLVSGSQVAVASSTFGFQKEFPVIAAAVLGGTSLFGGRGGVIGSVFGAVLIQTVENGLVMTNANPYIYPLVVSAIIFIAVFTDSSRTTVLERLERRKIRIEPN